MYVRISRDAEERGLGVERQRQDCMQLAEKQGWTVVDVFTDNDVSAYSGKPRPAYQRMAREIEAGNIRGVVVWDVDRLTRTPRELEDVIDWADEHDLALANVGGEIDLSTPQGRLTARMKGAVARHDVEQASRRIRRKRQELAENGRYVGPRPFGWDFTPDKRLVVREDEAAVVRESYRRILAGESIRSVTRDFNSRGIKTGRGSTWKSANFRQMILRWTNAGVLMHQGKEVGEGHWEALVTREEHERVISLLTDPSRRSNNRGTPEKYLLSGLLQCAECGDNLKGAKEYSYPASFKLADGSTKHYMRHQPYRYRCHEGCRAVIQRMEPLDAYVEGRVVGILEKEGIKALGGDAEAAETARARTDALDAKLNLAADQFADDLITPEQFARINARLRPQLEEARDALRRAMPPTDGVSEFVGEGAQEAWESAGLEAKRSVIRALQGAGLRIEVGKVGRRRGGQAGAAPFNPDTINIYWLDG